FDGAAHRSAELVQLKRSLLLRRTRVEEIACVEIAVADVLEKIAVQVVGAGLGHNRDLTARAASVFGGIRGRLRSKLLHVFEAERQPELGRAAAARVVGTRADE